MINSNKTFIDKINIAHVFRFVDGLIATNGNSELELNSKRIIPKELELSRKIKLATSLIY